VTTTATQRTDDDVSGPGPRRAVLVPALLGVVAVGGLVALPVVERWLWPGAVTSRGLVLRGPSAWALTAVTAGVVVVMLAVGLLRRTTWSYPEDDGRDLRIDMIRGLAITFVVLNHVNIPSLYQLLSQEAVGPVSGAELFVTLTGVVLGLVYRGRAKNKALVVLTGTLLARGGELYRTALLVVSSIFLLTLLPGVDGRVVTTFTDQGTGQTYGLYPNIERLLDYPVPGYVLRDILFLRLGPFQFNIMGLYVVLLAVAPLMVLLLRRRLVLVLLALSWLLYGLDAIRPTVVLSTQFQDPFPLLTWQLLFAHGLAVGWYRSQLLGWARRPIGKVVVAVVVLGQLLMMFFSWNNPFLSNAYDLRLALIPDDTFLAVYDRWFGRPNLELGRVLAVGLLLVSLYALLSAFWKPLHVVLGWFLVPLGQATLYVFILHVYFALIIANIPGLRSDHVLANTLAHALTLAALWLMVRTRFLFSIVPR
jgi:hypothetical protein